MQDRMKKIKFSLHPLRVLLDRQEQIALLQYAHMVMGFEEAKKRLQAADAEFDMVSLLFESRLNANCPAEELKHLDAYCQTLLREKKAHARDVQNAQRQVKLAFAKLVAARQAGVVVSRYHTIQKRQSAQERRKQEETFLDKLTQGYQKPLASEARLQPVWN